MKPPQRLWGLQSDGEQFAHLAVEIGEIALRVTEHGHGHIGQAFEARGEQPQHHALAGAGIAMNEGEAALAHMGLFDAPEEVLDLRRHEQRFGGQLGREGIPLEAVEGQQGLVHGRGSAVGG